MRITPLDVRKQEFRKVVRGLDPEEVYAFLATVAEEYEAALTDNKTLREQMLGLDEKVGEYRNMETALRDTLMTAERVNSETRQNAEKEAQLILERAKMEAEKQTASISARVDALRHQLRELRTQRDAYLTRLRTLSQTQLNLLDNYQRDFEADDRESVAAVPADSGSELASTPAPPAAVPPEPVSSAPAASGPESPVAEQEATRPIPNLAASPMRRPSGDQWRDYAVGAAPASRPGPAVPPSTPADPVVAHPGPGPQDDVEFELDPSEDLADVVAEVTAEEASSGHPTQSVATSATPESGSDQTPREPETVGAPHADKSGGWSMQRFSQGLQD